MRLALPKPSPKPLRVLLSCGSVGTMITALHNADRWGLPKTSRKTAAVSLTICRNCAITFRHPPRVPPGGRDGGSGCGRRFNTPLLPIDTSTCRRIPSRATLFVVSVLDSPAHMTQDQTRAQRPNTYDPSVLSGEEKQRFLAALGDGFGYLHRNQYLDEAALPREVETGLLTHRAYHSKDDPSKYWDHDEDEFWDESDGDSPPGLFEQCPISFQLPAIRKYFQEQKATYLAYVKSHNDYSWLDNLKPEEKSNWDQRIYDRVLYETYSKAWYEYHVNQQIYFLDESIGMLGRAIEQNQKIGLDVMLIQNFAGTLGRLVEQYYWKFLHEKAAIRGVKISESAKTGGRHRAAKHKHEHAAWRAAARLVRQERPASSTMTVASIVKQRLKIDRSVKHISRVLRSTDL